jgi:hypothetical protein
MFVGKDELDCFDEKFAYVIQIFCQKGQIRIKYFGSGSDLIKK